MIRKQLGHKSIFIISFLVVSVDQISKSIVTNLTNEVSTIALIPGLVNIHMVKNTGAAFSLFSNATIFLGALSLCVSIALIIWILRNNRFHILEGLSMAFLLGGCIGNGLDRWRYGYVNDFIQLVPINFPIFNGADIAINIAVLLFIIYSMDKKAKENVS